MAIKKRMAEGLLLGLKQATQIEAGEITGRTRRVKLAKPAPKWSAAAIKKLRVSKFDMSQPVFAALMNVQTSTIRAWEQGHRRPDGAASRLLEIMSKDSDFIEKIAS